MHKTTPSFKMFKILWQFFIENLKGLLLQYDQWYNMRLKLAYKLKIYKYIMRSSSKV